MGSVLIYIQILRNEWSGFSVNFVVLWKAINQITFLDVISVLGSVSCRWYSKMARDKPKRDVDGAQIRRLVWQERDRKAQISNRAKIFVRSGELRNLIKLIKLSDLRELRDLKKHLICLHGRREKLRDYFL